MNVPEGLLYTKEHEWVRIEGNRGTVGITDHAQAALGDITFVDLPKIGFMAKQSVMCATVESVKAASDIYAPVSGKVVAVNDMLNGSPELINKSPYGEGWFAVIEMDLPSEKSALLTPQQYSAYLAESEK